MRELSLFSGAGGGILGGALLGWKTVCAVEIEKYCIEILLQRQRDGILPRFPIWDDITTFDGKPWKGRVDIITGGFPCQDISSAGKGAGLEGERSGLWKEMARIICEVKPKWVLAENSPLLTIRGLGTVLGDLAKMGYDARWGVLGACDVGAPHRRDRIWILANSNEKRSRKIRTYIESSSQRQKSNDIRPLCKDVSNSTQIRNSRGRGLTLDDATKNNKWRNQSKRSGTDVRNTDISNSEKIRQGLYEQQTRNGTGIYKKSEPRNNAKYNNINGKQWWETESGLGRVADGVANRVDRIAAIGNGQVPSVAAAAFIILSQGWCRFEENNKENK